MRLRAHQTLSGDHRLVTFPPLASPAAPCVVTRHGGAARGGTSGCDAVGTTPAAPESKLRRQQAVCRRAGCPHRDRRAPRQDAHTDPGRRHHHPGGGTGRGGRPATRLQGTRRQPPGPCGRHTTACICVTRPDLGPAPRCSRCDTLWGGSVAHAWVRRPPLCAAARGSAALRWIQCPSHHTLPTRPRRWASA